MFSFAGIHDKPQQIPPIHLGDNAVDFANPIHICLQPARPATRYLCLPIYPGMVRNQPLLLCLPLSSRKNLWFSNPAFGAASQPLPDAGSPLFVTSVSLVAAPCLASVLVDRCLPSDSCSPGKPSDFMARKAPAQFSVYSLGFRLSDDWTGLLPSANPVNTGPLGF